MRLALFALAAAFAAAPLAAQRPAAAPSGPADPRINQVIVYGDDQCPPSTDEEITVCARLPDEDRFRIPSNLRDNPNDPANQAWAGRALELQYVGRTGTESCSTVGPGGFTGCLGRMINQARAERRGEGDVNWTRMVAEAREAREARLRAATQEEEETDRREPN